MQLPRQLTDVAVQVHRHPRSLLHVDALPLEQLPSRQGAVPEAHVLGEGVAPDPLRECGAQLQHQVREPARRTLLL